MFATAGSLTSIPAVELDTSMDFNRWRRALFSGLALTASFCLFACGDDGADGDDDGSESTTSADDDDGGTGDPDPNDAVPNNLADGPTIVGLEVATTTGDPIRNIAVDHPIHVDLWLAPVAGDTTIHDNVYHIGLVEKHAVGANHSTMHTCQLGTLRTPHGPDAVDEFGRVHVRGDFVVPDHCLADATAGRLFNLWVSANPALEGVHDEAGGVHSQDYNTQFFNAEQLDTDGKNRNLLCIGPNGVPGCVIDLNVHPSPGRDIEFRNLWVDSSVFSVWPDCSLATGHPDIETHLDLRMWGQDSFTDTVGGELPADVLDEELRITYSLCPRDEASGACTAGTNYHALGVLGHPDHAQTPDLPVQSYAPLRDMHAAAPQRTHHDLHVENDPELCHNLMNLPGATTDWSHFNRFNLRGCVSSPTTHVETGHCELNGTCSDGHHALNNCKVVPMRLVRAPTTERRSATKSFGYTWDKNSGGSVVGASAKFWSDTVFSLDGATTSNGGQFDLTGWASAEIFKTWFDGQAYVSLVGSGYDTGVRIFSKNLWSKSQTVPEVTYENTQSIAKQLCYNYNYGIAGIGLNASLCASGSASLTVNASISAVEGGGPVPFDSSTRIGEASATVTPGASFGLTATASANVVVARGGITGTLNLIVISLPITGKLNWGLIDGPQLVLTNNLSVGLDTSFLSGNLNVWVDLIKPKWCSCGSWCPGYPCSSWSSVVNQTLVSFTAYSLNRTVYDNSVVNPLFLP